MSLRCRPGDLAVIVRSNAGNEGKFVSVRDEAGIAPLRFGGGWVHYEAPGAFCWWVESPHPLIGEDGSADSIFPIADSWLRPIRDNDGQDETITWADRPQELPIECITALREMT